MSNPWQAPQQTPQPGPATQPGPAVQSVQPGPAAQAGPAEPAKPKLTRQQRKAAKQLERQQREAARGESCPYNLFYVRHQKDGFSDVQLEQVTAALVLGPRLIQLQYYPGQRPKIYQVTRVRSIIRPWTMAIWLLDTEPPDPSTAQDPAKPPVPDKHLIWMFRPGERGHLDIGRKEWRSLTELLVGNALIGVDEIIGGTIVLGMALGKLFTQLAILVSMPFAIARIRQRIAVAKRFREQLGL